MAQEKCSNCGQSLTESNIRQALDEAGLPQDELRFYCPGFNSKKDICSGYDKGDETSPANWRTN